MSASRAERNNSTNEGSLNRTIAVPAVLRKHLPLLLMIYCSVTLLAIIVFYTSRPSAEFESKNLSADADIIQGLLTPSYLSNYSQSTNY
jgi:hypothetical protein